MSNHRFRRLSALTSLLLATGAVTSARAQSPFPTLEKVPASEGECRDLVTTVLEGVSMMSKDPGMAVVNFLNDTNFDKIIYEQCSKGNFEQALNTARGYMPDPNRKADVPQGPLPDCTEQKNLMEWSVYAGVAAYRMSISVPIEVLDSDRMYVNSANFIITESATGAPPQIGLMLIFRDGQQPKELDVEIKYAGKDWTPESGKAPIENGTLNLTKLMAKSPVGSNIELTASDGKPLFQSKFYYPPNVSARAWGFNKSIELERRYKSGGCVQKQCFLTTACCEEIGLADDCFELTALRRFRDRVLMKTAHGAREVEQYYDIAPRILDRLRSSGQQAVLVRFYATHILPCAILAELGFNKLTMILYRDLISKIAALAAAPASSIHTSSFNEI